MKEDGHRSDYFVRISDSLFHSHRCGLANLHILRSPGKTELHVEHAGSVLPSAKVARARGGCGNLSIGGYGRNDRRPNIFERCACRSAE